MEYRWRINLTGTLPDGHTPDLTITPRGTGNRYRVPCSCVPCKCSVPHSFEKIFLIVPSEGFALTLFYNRSNLHRTTAMNYNSAVISELNVSGRLRNFLHALRTALNSSSENLPSS